MPSSSDGVLTVTARPLGAVAIDITWPSTPIPWLTRVVRVVGTTETLIRSADPAYTPGGSGFAQDNEAPAGATVTYKAYGYNGINPTPTRTSTTVSVATTAVASPAWARWKPLGDLSLSVELPTSIAWTRPRQQEEFSPKGVPSVVYQYGIGGRRGTLKVATLSASMRDRMRDILDMSQPVLVQFDASVGVADVWAVLGDDPESPVGPRRSGVTEWPVAFIERDRPDTTGAPLIVPGWSYTTADAAYATYALRDAAWASYRALAKGV